MVAIGLQHRNVDDLAKVRLVPKLDPMPASQMLGHFKRAIIRINEELKSLQRVSFFNNDSRIHLDDSRKTSQIPPGPNFAPVKCLKVSVLA